MNLLEHHIKEIISVEPYEAEWTKKHDKKFLEIQVVTDCHGCIEESSTIESEDNWDKIKEQGYFLW